mmetsp:Transcript_36869/g.48436  ORF Transcript_36869/g.48436 Transcript_36869/m.48436 type:complete len:110 (-) Transcript_36869:1375-1704(-)
MKALTTFLSFLLVMSCTSAFGQTELGTTSKLRVDPVQPTHVERYGVDYTLKDYTFTGDSTILESIDLDYLEQFRLATQDIEVVDTNTGLTVVLFYRKHTGKTTVLSHDD